MAYSVFIDGEAGTTGLQIRERLEKRADIALIQIDSAQRKDAKARADALNSADAAILCLPDDAAREAVALVTNPKTKIIDASTAHRVAPDWAYGFAEMASGQRAKIAASTRISNPGCYPTGFIALVAPLVRAGLLPEDYPLTVNAVSGYSGGGKGLIEEFVKPLPSGTADAFRTYGLSLAHKHVPEMTLYTGLTHAPVFAPSVGRYAQGMIVDVPLHMRLLKGTPSALRETLAQAYDGARFVSVASEAETAALQKVRAGAGGYVPDLDPEALNGTNDLRLFVFASADGSQARLVALLDNLGKGASGAAVQNLNIALGLPEAAGL
jgi:N-acetyl-gamma-glutamyl-phosphate reductase